MYNASQIKELPDYPGVAESLRDFFVPNQCVGCILVRKGKLKQANGEVVDFIMAGTQLDGNLNLVCYKKKKRGKKWISSTCISSDDFAELIVNTYNLK